MGGTAHLEKRENEVTTKTLDDAIKQNHAALDAMVKGDSTGYVALLSDRGDVTWGNRSARLHEAARALRPLWPAQRHAFGAAERPTSIASQHIWPTTLRSWSKWNTRK